MRKLKTFLFLLLGILFVSLVVLTLAAREFIAPVSSEKKIIRVAIPQGALAGDVSRELEEKGIVRHAWSFHLLIRLTRTDKKIKAGTYDLSPSLSPYKILKSLVEGKGIAVRITIPEGYTVKQIARLLSSKGIVNKEEFLGAAQAASIILPPANERTEGLEGFLFPDTYELQPDILPEQVYKPMIQRFKELVIPLYEKSFPKMSLKSIIILASLIEREARIPKERALIAAVYYNRLKNGMPLQCDATIQYLLPSPTVNLTEEDLKIDSLYNTYLHQGLPPGPIGNPGLESIKAAIHPANAPYFYYVARGNGGHIFSTTYPEHLHNVRLYSRWLLKHGLK